MIAKRPEKGPALDAGRIMLTGLVLEVIGWAVLLTALFTLLERLGVYSRPGRFTEETMTRLWRESAITGGEESRPAPTRPS
jgi:hypothetical protein